MNNYKIIEVKTRADQVQFLEMARRIYRDDENWVQPLDGDIEAVFDRAKNAQFVEGDAARWLLLAEGEPVGRIAAFYNTETAAKETQPIGGCGFFECVNDQRAADMLFDTARDWLARHGMQAMDGSVNFGDRLMWWGVLVEGFTQPLYGMNYNKPYYGELFENYGFCNYFNQHTYLRKLGADVYLNDLVLEKANRLFENPDYEFRSFDVKNMPKMAEDFRTVYNSGWANFEGGKPLTEHHARQLLKTMRPVIDPQVMIFAYHCQKPVGFFIMLPDLNQIIGRFGGRLGLLEKLRLMWSLKVNKTKVNRLVGIVFGVAAEQQGRGVEAGMIRHFDMLIEQSIEKGVQRYKTLEMSWVGDFNPVMMRMCENYVRAVKYKRHVTYRYLFDRAATFERCPRLGRKRN